MYLYKLKTIFRQIFSSKLFSNLWNQTILTGVSYIIPLLLVPFLLNRLGVEYYGLINFALAFSFYFQIVNEFGFDLSNVRHVVANRDNPDGLSKVFYGILRCKSYLILVTFVVYGILVLLVPTLRAEWVLYVLTFIRLYGIILSPSWLFRSMEDSKFITRISLPLNILCVLPVFFIVKSSADYLWVMFFYAVQCLIPNLVAIIFAIKQYNLHRVSISLSDVKFYLKDSIPFFTSTLLMRVYQNSNPFILGLFCGNSAVGIYTAADKLHNAYASFVAPIISKVLYPYFTRIRNVVRMNKITIIVVLCNVLCLAAMYFLSPYFLPLVLKVESNAIVTYFNWFLVVLLFSVPCELLGFSYLGVIGQVKKVTSSTLIAAITYLFIVAFLFGIGHISVKSLILTLGIVNVVNLTLRLYYIRKSSVAKL